MSVQNGRRTKPLRIAFLHPDLGIGGAERLVVDAAVALQTYGHTVHLFSSHHDQDHCFEETRPKEQGGKLKVFVAGDSLPRQFLGRFAIIFSILRGIWLSLYLLWHWGDHNPLVTASHTIYQQNKDEIGEYDIVITDQLSIYNLFLLFTESSTVFYCHFPDLLLSKRENNPALDILKRFYRAPINWVEEKTTGLADKIIVNSQFTGKTFAKTFTSLASQGIEPDVLYPSILMSAYDNNFIYDKKVAEWWSWYKNGQKNGPEPEIIPAAELSNAALDYSAIEAIDRKICVIVSINRFERKKEVEQGIYGLIAARNEFAKKHEECTKNDKIKTYLPFNSIKLIIAGGYDHLVEENVLYHQELASLAKSHGCTTSNYPDCSGDIVFLRSFSQTQRTSLLRRSQAILYTPENEHFGIVPVEAMYSSRSVIAHASGGPLESIVDEKTGFLCQKHDPHNIVLSGSRKVGERTFGDAMYTLLTDTNNSALTMNIIANQHCKEKFSIQTFSKQWNDIVIEVSQSVGLGRTQPEREFLTRLGQSPRSRLVKAVQIMVMIIVLVLYLLSKAKWLPFGR